MHSSNGNLIHSATLMAADTGERLGGVAYQNGSGNSASMRRSGGSTNATSTGWDGGRSASRTSVCQKTLATAFSARERTGNGLNGRKGTLGHLDMGYGWYMLGAHNHNAPRNATSAGILNRRSLRATACMPDSQKATWTSRAPILDDQSVWQSNSILSRQSSRRTADRQRSGDSGRDTLNS